MTLNQLAYRIIRFVESGRLTNQNNTSFRQVCFDIHQMRSLLVRREEQTLDFTNFVQSINLTLEENKLGRELSIYTSNNIAVSENVKFLRSTTTIPKRIDLKVKHNLRIPDSNIMITSPYSLEYESYNRFSKGLIQAAEINKYIVVAVPPVNSLRNTDIILNNKDYSYQDLFNTIENPTSITVEAIFENPQEIVGFKKDEEYPCSNQMEFRIIESLIKRYLREDKNISDTETNLMEDDDDLLSR